MTTTKTKDKPVELNQLERFVNQIMDLNHSINHFTKIPFQTLMDCYDKKRGEWRMPKGLQRVELVWYGTFTPMKILRQHGVYAFAILFHRRVVPFIDGSDGYKQKFEKRPVIRLYVRRRQLKRANQLIDKYAMTDGTLNWVRCN